MRKERFWVGQTVYHGNDVARGEGQIVDYRHKDESDHLYTHRFLVQWANGSKSWCSDTEIKRNPNRRAIEAQAAAQRVQGYHQRHRELAQGS